MVYWYSMCLSMDGHIRVATLKNHLRQNNEFLKCWYPAWHLPEWQRLKPFKRVMRLVIYLALLMNMAAHICVSGLSDLYLRASRRQDCHHYCEQAHFPQMTCREMSDITINIEGNTYNQLFHYDFPITTMKEQMVRYQECMYFALHPGEEGRLVLSYMEPNRRESADICFTKCIRTESSGLEDRVNVPKCKQAQSQAEYDAQFDEYIGAVPGRNGDWYNCTVPEDPSSENKCDIFYQGGLTCVSERTRLDDVPFPMQLCIQGTWLFGDWCISAGQIALVLALSNVVHFIVSMVIFRSTELRETNAFSSTASKFAYEVAIVFIYFSVFMTMIGPFSKALFLQKSSDILVTFCVTLLADQLKSLMLAPIIWWVFIQRCGYTQSGIQEYNENYIMQFEAQRSLMTILRDSVMNFLVKPRVTSFMSFYLIGSYTLFVLLQLAFFDQLLSKFELIVVIFRYLDLAYIILFIVELVMKCFAFGPQYMSDPWNCFDAGVIAGTVALWVIFTSQRGGSKGLGLLRLVRLARMMVIVRHVSQMRKKLDCIKKSKSTGYEVGSHVDTVLDMLDELHNQNGLSPPQKEDLIWITDIIVGHKLYKISFDKGEGSAKTNSAWIEVTDEHASGETQDESSNMSNIMASGVKRSGVGQQMGQSKLKSKGGVLVSRIRSQAGRDDTNQLNVLLYSRSNLSAGEEGQIESALSNLREWSCDLMMIAEVLDVNLIPVVFLKLTIQYDFVSHLHLDFELLFNYCTLVQGRAKKLVPFHSLCLMVEMLQACHFFFIHGLDGHLEHFDKFTLFFACLVAGDGHPGLTNDFLVNSRHPQAIRYNDSAILQNYNLAQTFVTLQDPELNFFSHGDKAMCETFRKVLINIILKLDLRQHFSELSIFNTKLASDFPIPGNEEDKMVLMATTLRMADFAWACRPLQQFLLWSDKFSEEFFAQGALEKQMGLPVSTFCDRDMMRNTSKCQLSFIMVIVQPIAVSFAVFLDDPIVQTQVIDEGLEANRAYLRSWVG